MKIDPAFCQHTSIKKSVRVETVSIPELGIEQLCLRVKIYCGECKEAFPVKTRSQGFSTDEIGVVGDELFIPLEYPMEDAEEEVSEADVDPAEIAKGSSASRGKESLH